MKKTKSLIRVPLLGRIILFIYRFKVAFGYFVNPLWQLLQWMVQSREITNFTYALSERNLQYLAFLIADVTEKSVDEITKYIIEIESDEALREHVKKLTIESSQGFISDSEAKFGRRVGWYAFVRAKKPKIVVETGVDKGLGSCVLTAALQRNAEEGHLGYYYGTDIDPKAGYLFQGDYKNFGQILYGDSIESLRNFDLTIDLFINDSAHSSLYEEEEYKVIAPKLSSDAIILGDNSHVSDELMKFAMQKGLRFLFFKESPLNHWYPGGGIGIAFKR